MYTIRTNGSTSRDKRRRSFMKAVKCISVSLARFSLMNDNVSRDREDIAYTGCLQSMRRSIVWETLWCLLLRRLLVLLQAICAPWCSVYLHRSVHLWAEVKYKTDIVINVTSACHLLATGSCTVAKATRNFCPHCRLKKCFSVGMNTTGKRNSDASKVIIINYNESEYLP